MKVLDKVLNDFITKSSNDKNNRIKFFYENQMWSNNKNDEKHLKTIVKKNVTPVDQKKFYQP